MSSDVEKCLYGFFEAILDEMSDGIYITDRAGTTICVNKMYEQLTGLRKDDIRGRDVRDLVGSGVFDIALNPEIVRTGKPTTHVQHLKDGKTLVLSGYPVFDDDGGLRFVVTFARDITLMTRLNDQINRQRSLVSQTAGQIEYVARRQLLKSQSPTFASQSMKRVITLVDRVAPTDATVLILGETGVGKDVIARLILNKSSRRDKLMLKVDCGGISETLTESEMFGYVGGAFTGASSKGKAGYFEIANGSTVFLDEIGELPLSMQTRLLRVLQEGKTAALIAAACEMGCVVGGGGAKQVEAAQRFGIHIGLCFQMIDDILDVTSTPEKLGKPVGSDASNEKTTYVSLLGVDEVRRLAQEHTQAALAALKPFKKDTENLRLLAERLLARSQ